MKPNLKETQEQKAREQGIPTATVSTNKEYCPVCGKIVDKGIFCGNDKCPYKNIQLNS